MIKTTLYKNKSTTNILKAKNNKLEYAKLFSYSGKLLKTVYYYLSLNGTDKSKRYIAQVKYSVKNYSFLTEYFINKGKNNSEYSDILIRDKLSFHLSWRYN